MQLVAALGAALGLDCVADFLGTLQLHRIGPTVVLVHQVAQAVIGVLVARRCDVETAPCGQLQARGAEMQFNPILVAVTDPEHVILLAVQPGKGQLLKGVHHFGLLDVARRIHSGKADHARAVGPLVAAGVDQSFCACRIATQHLGQRVARHGQRLAIGIADQVAIAVIGQHALGHEVADRSRARALAVGEELDQHCRASSRSWASWRSITSRRRATVRLSRSVRPTSMALFSHLAIWLRLPPMRPTASTRAGSTRGTGLRRRASVRPSASRRSVAAGRPAVSALERRSAFSVAVQRKTKVSVSGSFARAFPAPVGFEGEAWRVCQ